MKREQLNSREMTQAEQEAVAEIQYLMSFVNEETYSEEAKQEFTMEVVLSGAAHAMKDRYILTEKESAGLIAALRKLTGRRLS